MERRYGFKNQGRGEEFREEDVWDVIKEEREKPLVSISRRRLPSAARMIPGAEKHEEPKVIQQHSAPVNIPDWSKIYGKTPKRKNDTTNTSNSGSTSSTLDDDDGSYDAHHDECYHDDDDDDDDDDGMALPPHEWLAKKLSRNQISSFSVCEGAGRTLKGRDLSRVRNAILSKTGFI